MIDFKTRLVRIINKTEDLLFSPHACICCGRECEDDNKYRICSRCLKTFPFNNGNYCLKCGERILGDYDYCVNCKNNDYAFDYARSVFSYNDLTANIIMNFKYNGYKTHAKILGKMLKDYYDNSDIVADVVTYVPMPAKREKQRGYNQARELAKEFCSLSNMTFIDALKRVKDNVKQANLSRKERVENIKGSFEIINKSLVKNKDVLLIDDVLTTGATASECAKTLNKAGARSVVVFTLAKTEQRKI